jgi:hypothetical protein
MSDAPASLLRSTPLLDIQHPDIERLVVVRGWRALPMRERIGAVYDFVRDEVAFGYNEADDLPASRVLADGHGQCNTKGTLLMALLRSVGVPCRFHGFTIDKALQKGAITGAPYRTLRTTNPIENLNGSVAHYCHNVKRWGDGQMVLRWVASALSDAAARMRKLCGCGQMRTLLQALDARFGRRRPEGRVACSPRSRQRPRFNSERDNARWRPPSACEPRPLLRLACFGALGSTKLAKQQPMLIRKLSRFALPMRWAGPDTASS